MIRSFSSLLLGLVLLSAGVSREADALSPAADDPKPAMRPISEADSILAVYREEQGFGARKDPAVVFVAWPDGYLVWSADRLKGGAPYRAGRIEAKKVAALLARFEKDGLLADEKLNKAHFGPDAPFITVHIKSGKRQLKMQSWHELFEESDEMVADHRGVARLEGRRRLDVLRNAPTDYQFYRFVWSETRSKLTDLIPVEGTATAGKPSMKAGVLSWQEPTATPKPNGRVGQGPPLIPPYSLSSILMDAGLCAAFDRASTLEDRNRCLVKMTRRGSPRIVAFLNQRHNEFLDASNDRRKRGFNTDVDLLTTLRRAQGKPDPLPIVTSVAGAELESIFPNLPTIDATLMNCDIQESPITFKEGGDYRSGRQDRWRFDVRDSRGKVMPVRHRLSATGGGISRLGVLRHGESWKTVLPMRKFIELPLGDYTVVVEYHDQKTISDLPDTAGLVVCRSEPFKLHIQPRVIDLAKAHHAAARDAVAFLGDARRVGILEGPYGKDAHRFIPPDTAAGKLLALGWRAVPALLDALDEKELSLERRAWVFAMLFSITGCNDPRDRDGVLAGFESRESAWVVTGGRGDSDGIAGLGLGGSRSMSGGKLKAEAQTAFAKEWKAFRDCIVVREKP